MSSWWVNHKQTFRHEFRGGYIWSPKRRKDGSRNIFYDYMRLVRPGDTVISYADGHVKGIGLAKSHCYTSPRPDEFGHIGEVWDAIGWRVDVGFLPAVRTIRPRDMLGEIGQLIGMKHSPLGPDGNGRQAVYLAAISDVLASSIRRAVGIEAAPLQAEEGGNSTNIEIDLPGVEEWERIERQRIESAAIPETDRLALIRARLGQGRFKENVSRIEICCRLTRVSNPVHLIASHIKPWRESSNEERLAAGNGLLLTPSIDHLFDRGFISFEDTGQTLISPVADPDSLRRMGVNVEAPPRVGGFNSDQRHFLQHHRSSIFLAAVSE